MSRPRKQLLRRGNAQVEAVVTPQTEDNTGFFVIAIVVCVGFVMANEMTTRYALIKESLYALTAIGALLCLSMAKADS